MKTIFIFFCTIISLEAFGQKTHDELIQEFLEQRKQMMEKVMKAFDDDSFFDDDFDDSGLFDQIRKQGFKGFNGFNSSGNNVKIVEKVEDDGSMSILITPKNESVKLDIETTDHFIKIKSEMMEKVENQQGKSFSSNISRSSFTQSIRIPNGFEAQNPTAQGKSIKIVLVPKDTSIIKSSYPKGKKPIGKRPGEKAI